MFRSLKRGNLSSYSKYQVAVVTQSFEQSSLFGTPKKSVVIANRLKRVGISFMGVLSIFMIIAMGSIFSAPGANAINLFKPVEDAVEKTVKQTFCNQAAFGLKSQDIGFLYNGKAPKGSQPTMYEKYGMSGMSYSSFTGFDTVEDSITGNGGRGIGGSESVIAKLGGDAHEIGLSEWEKPLQEKQYSGLNNYEQKCGVMTPDTLMTVIANGFLWGAQVSTWAGNTIFEMVGTTSESLWETMEENLTKIANTLWDGLYFAYMTPMISIAAVVMFWQGAVKRQVINFFQSLMWLIGVIVASAFMAFKPLFLPELISQTSGLAGQEIISQINKIGANDSTDLCYATGKNKSIREFQCTQYQVFVYEPWVRGQFGVSSKQLAKNDNFEGYVGRKVLNEDIPLSTLKTTDGSQMNITNVKFGNRTPADQSWALYYLDYKSNWDDASTRQKVNKVRAQMHVFANQLGSENPNRDFSGENGVDRLMASMIGSASSTASAILVFAISLEILILDFYILVMGLFIPLFALLALHPTQGRRIATGYFETMVKYGLRRLILAIYLAVAILALRTFALNPSTNPLVQLITVIVIVAVLLKLKSAIAGMFNRLSITGLPEGAPEPNLNGASQFLGRGTKMVGAGVAGGLLGGGLATLANKKSLKSVASKVAGSGKAPQSKAFGKSAKDTAKELSAKTTDDKQSIKMSQRKQEKLLADKGNLNDETSNEAPQGDNSGSGSTPQEPRETAQVDEAPSVPNVQDAGIPNDGSGSGEAPQAETEAETQNPVAPLTVKQQKQEAKATTKRIAHELKANGYRSRVGLATVLGATIKGAYVGAKTGSVRSAVGASSSTVNRKKQAIQQANAQVVKSVTQQERNRNFEIARQQRATEFEKAQAKRKAEREANQKKFAEARAKWKSSKSNQQGKPASAPQQESTNGKAPQKPRNSQGSTLNVSKPANDESAPRVEAPRAEVPRAEAPAPQPVSNPAKHVNEAPRVEIPRAEVPREEAPRQTAPRVKAPRQNAPAPQPVREPRVEAPRVEIPREEAPRQNAPAPQPVREPRVETPRVEIPREEAPRQNAPAPQPVREPRVEAPKQTAPRVKAPRAEAPASKPVIKESKQKASNPTPPAPPVKAPAPKAKVNPPKAQAPMPPTRRSLRESGNQTPPAPKPPQPRKR